VKLKETNGMTTQITRRSALATLGAGAALAVSPAWTAASAAVTAAGKATPAFYRHKIGDIEVTQLADGTAQFPLADNFVRNAPKAEVQAALTAAYLPPDKATVFFNPMMLNTSGKLVLIDTGMGPGPSGAVGQLLANMNAAGVEGKAVDVVVISHFHPDHINGLRLADGSLTFPNAEIKVPAAEWAFWMNDENMAKAPDAVKGPFANARKVFDKMGDRVTQYEMDKELAPGLTPFATPGHTPGHTSFALQSGASRLIIQSDITNNPALFLRNPDWHVMYDMNPQQAVTTRRAFFDRASADKTLIAGFHFPFPCLGYVEKDGANFRLSPATWQTTI
jgi:glyoxylase-like metal-dependent hydrolase (beta-lactamase superfamily II)